MYVNLSSSEADAIALAIHPGENRPISKSTKVRDVNDLSAWITNDKPESVEKPWKYEGISICLELARHLRVPLPAGHFPACFHLSDGRKRFPDKAIVKAALRERYLEGAQNLIAPEILIFRTTPETPRLAMHSRTA